MIGYVGGIEEGQEVNVTDNITTTSGQMHEQQIQHKQWATIARRTVERNFFGSNNDEQNNHKHNDEHHIGRNRTRSSTIVNNILGGTIRTNTNTASIKMNSKQNNKRN